MDFGTALSSASQQALSCPLLYSERIAKEERGKENIYHLQFGYRPVRLPERKEQFYMVVVQGFGQDAMMLLPDVWVKKSRKSFSSTLKILGELLFDSYD